MNISVYLSSENIVVVSGKKNNDSVRVKSLTTVPLPEGTVINGMILNEELIRTNLMQLRSKRQISKKNVRLVIDRSSVLIKFIKVPNMKARNIMGFIQNSFSGTAKTYDELVYDYSVISTSKTKGEMNLILACAIEKSLVEDYNNLFLNAGIKLSSIDIALNSILKFQNHCKEFKNKTFMVLFVDGETVFSILFANGKYKFSNRIRLISKRGTPESTAEFADHISSVIQFNKAQKSNPDIEFVLIAGLSDNEKELCNELTSTLNISTKPFVSCSAVIPDKKIANKQKELTKNLFAVANLLD